MALFDLQTVSFLGLEITHLIADIGPPQEGSFGLAPGAFSYLQCELIFNLADCWKEESVTTRFTCPRGRAAMESR